MARLVIELTNRCNLQCRHCFEERHAGTGDLPVEILQQALVEGKHCGIDHISFTGGEPTLHRQFATILGKVSHLEYSFSLVSNGTNFLSSHALLLKHRRWLTGVTFSLDGAREATHDRLRGAGSYRQVLRAATICVFREIPFTLNMVITAHNRAEVAEMVSLAARLGSAGVRFAHLMPTLDTARHQLDLTPQERREVEAVIGQLGPDARVPVGMAPGYYSESPFFPCAPLELQEFNLDYKGNLSLCCQLSGRMSPSGRADTIANLRDVSLAEACEQFGRRVATYLTDKRERVKRGQFGDLDHFPCLYCVKYLETASMVTTGAHGGSPARWFSVEAEYGR
jgi:pyruvate-formate lyase-activating enzyme